MRGEHNLQQETSFSSVDDDLFDIFLRFCDQEHMIPDVVLFPEIDVLGFNEGFARGNDVWERDCILFLEVYSIWTLGPVRDLFAPSGLVSLGFVDVDMKEEGPDSIDCGALAVVDRSPEVVGLHVPSLVGGDFLASFGDLSLQRPVVFETPLFFLLHS